MESTPEQLAEGAAIVKVLAEVLDRIVISNASIARQDPGQVTKFHALKAPGIGILPYLERIHKYAACSNECFILALIYIDRLIQRNNFLLSELNVHRVVITAILLAAKFFDDAYYNNAYYSKVGGVLVSEMNGLEVDFLFRINFSLHVAPDVFEKYKAELIAHAIQSSPIPTVSPQMPPIEEPIDNMASVQIPTFTQMQALAAPLPLVQHQPQQVTSSIASQNLTATVEAYAARALEQQVAFAAAEQHLISTQQQLYRRANSLPFVNGNTAGCAYNMAKGPQYHSAPMSSILPGGTDEQYMLAMSRQLLPLQTTLVHHNHDHSTVHDAYAQNGNTSSYQLANNNNLGPLVAGRY